MLSEIDPKSQQPIFEQVIQQIKFAIAAGALRETELLPSVRDLSKQLVINPNTVARAYRQLQDDGVAETRRGIGLEIAAGAEEKCKIQRKEYFVQRSQTFLAEAARSGLTKKEINEIINNNN
jgi:GntR family transcriptional regulator